MTHIPTTTNSDDDGANLVRIKTATKGWSYHGHGLEVTTSKIASIINKDHTDTDWGFTTLKFYNSSDVELVAGTQAELDANCVKTVVDWEPTYDYELIGGRLRPLTAPGTDVCLWVIAVPDVPYGSGGTIPFISGLNLRYLGTGGMERDDGRSSKRLNYDATYHTNKVRMIFRHGAGVQCSSLFVFEMYKL